MRFRSTYAVYGSLCRIAFVSGTCKVYFQPGLFSLMPLGTTEIGNTSNLLVFVYYLLSYHASDIFHVVSLCVGPAQ